MCKLRNSNLDHNHDQGRNGNKKRTRAFSAIQIQGVLISIVVLLLSLIGHSESQRTINSFRSYAHGVQSGRVILLNQKQIQIPNFRYDGTGPAAYFAVGRNGNFWKERPGKDFLKYITLVPDENRSANRLRRYNGKTITLTLPRGITTRDINFLMVHCIHYHHNFGYVEIPHNNF